MAKPKVLDSIRVSKATGSGNFQKVEPLVEDRAGLSSKEPEQGVCTTISDIGGGFGDRCKNLHYGGSTGLSNKLDQFNSDLFYFSNY